jgi:hypothetical protein
MLLTDMRNRRSTANPTTSATHLIADAVERRAEQPGCQRNPTTSDTPALSPMHWNDHREHEPAAQVAQELNSPAADGLGRRAKQPAE